MSATYICFLTDLVLRRGFWNVLDGCVIAVVPLGRQDSGVEGPATGVKMCCSLLVPKTANDPLSRISMV